MRSQGYREMSCGPGAEAVFVGGLLEGHQGGQDVDLGIDRGAVFEVLCDFLEAGDLFKYLASSSHGF